jgi:hypothetical protein
MEKMLPEEEQKSNAVLVQRSSMLLNSADAFDNIRKVELFTT